MSSGEEEEEVKIEIPPKPCTLEILQSGLSRIGKTYDGNSHAFITLKLINEGLIDLVEEIGGYVHLRHLDLSGNKLPSADQLSSIPYILTLNISGSQLTDLDCFNNADAFTYLQTMDLSDNQLPALTALKLPRLIHLNLSGCQITDLSKFEGLPLLQTLDLSKNLIAGLQGCGNMPVLEKLNLQKNKITSILHIENVPKLTNIDFEGNLIEQLESEDVLPDLPAVTFMSFKANAFTDMAAIKSLNFYWRLEDIDITECAGFEELADSIKKEVLIQIPELPKVNGEEVEEEEREEAKAEAEERAKAAEEARLEAEREAREAAEREGEQAED